MIRKVIRNPRGVLSHKWTVLVRNLFYPDRFYDDHVVKYGLKWELIFLLFTGSIGALGFYYGVQTLLSEFALGAGEAVLNPDQTRMDDTTARQLRYQVAHPLVGIFVLWGYYTTTYYVGSWLFSGHGTYFKLLKNTAWALVPYFIANVVLAIAYFVTYYGLEIQAELPGLPDRNVAFLLGQGYEELPLMLVPLAKIALLAWVTYIGVSAIQDAQKLSRERALQIAAVPAVLHAGYLLWEVLGRAGVL